MIKTKIATIGIILTFLAASSAAQLFDEPRIMEFHAGDLNYRAHAYLSAVGAGSPAMSFLPDTGLNGDIYRATVDGQPGWLEMVNDQGWNGYALDLVGCGRSTPPPSDDLPRLIERSLYAVLQAGIAPASNAVFAPGVSAAFLIKSYTDNPNMTGAAILLDPIGPPGTHENPELTPEEIVYRVDHAEDWLWVKWGFGPEQGKSYGDMENAREEFAFLMDQYQADQPAYWAAALTGLQGGLDITDPQSLEGWPVLIVRSPHCDPQQVEMELSLRAWLEENGALVDFLDLSELKLAGLSAMPMVGIHSREVLDHLQEWARIHTEK